MRPYLRRTLLTVLLLVLAFLAFCLPPHPTTITRTAGDDTSITTVQDHGYQFFEWIGVVLLALALWIWRGILKLTTVGPLSGPLLEQQTPDELERAARESNVEQQAAENFADAAAQMERHRFERARSYVLDYLSKHHAMYAFYLAHEIGVSRATADILLDSLVAEGLVRRDGFPRRTLYTLASSLENRAIDYVRDKFIRPRYRLLSERRFVRVGKAHELDALLECEERTFVIEVRFVRYGSPTAQIKAGVRQLGKVASEFVGRALGGYLVLVLQDPEYYNAAKKQVESMTLDADKLPIIAIVVTKDEIDGAASA